MRIQDEMLSLSVVLRQCPYNANSVSIIPVFKISQSNWSCFSTFLISILC